MNKTTKHAITITVYALVALYFLVFLFNGKGFGPTKNTACSNFEQALSSKIESYFITLLPQTNGTSVKVTVEELIAKGYITLEDVENIGTSCSGTAHVVKAGDRYYYYNDISCGECSIDNMYTAWSGWEDTLPSFGKKKYQVMVSLLYNYSSSEEKWTAWSEWGESIDKIKAPEIPVGVEIINTETQEKQQYRSREASYQWYKLSSNTEYYNNGAYSVSAPSGYERLDSTKRQSRITKAYETKTELKQKENVKDEDIVTVNGYRVKTPKYIYSYTTESSLVEDKTSCEEQVTKYICYKTTDQTYSVADVSTDQATALSTCKAQQPSWASTCTTYQSSTSTSCPSGYTPDGSSCTKTYHGTHKYRTQGSSYEENICDSQKTEPCYLCKNSNASSCTGTKHGTWQRCKSTGNNTWWVTFNCQVWHVCDSGDTLQSDYITCKSTKTPTTTIKYGYKYTVTTRTDSTDYYTTCPSSYPNRDTSKSKVECTKYKTNVVPGTTYYVKANGGTTTNKSEAAYLSETEFNNLKKTNTSLSKYVKTGSPMYSYQTDYYVEGNCPSGSTCDTKTLYKAIIYEYKWFKVGPSTKTMCNNGNYSSSSPASGCTKDESTVKWGEWTEYSDKEIKKTSSNEVETKKLIRYRRSYVNSKDLINKEWYPYEEFEEKTGKKIDDLRRDSKINLQEKIVYKYRIKK